MGIRFGEVSGNFIIDGNPISSLYGSPRIVGGHFRCGITNISTLEGSPDKVGAFYCSYNKLVTLEGSPRIVEYSFSCSGNPLVSFKGAPYFIGGTFSYSREADDRNSVFFEAGQWGFEGFLDLYLKGKEVQKRLIHPLIDPEIIQKRIDKDPELLVQILKSYQEGSPAVKKIISPLADPKMLQKKIDQSPEKMAIILKPYLKSDWLKGLNLKWPKNLEDDVDLLGDLESIGL